MKNSCLWTLFSFRSAPLVSQVACVVLGGAPRGSKNTASYREAEVYNTRLACQKAVSKEGNSCKVGTEKKWGAAVEAHSKPWRRPGNVAQSSKEQVKVKARQIAARPAVGSRQGRRDAGTLQKAPAASQSKSRLPASPPAGIINRALITGIL